MTDITIISGFLGAGKTTLIKKLLEGPLRGKRVAVIENDYGDINIDGEFLKETGVSMTEIMSGCICCTLVGDFSRALVDLKSSYDPDRIIIEPSGVGKLTDVVRVVDSIAADPANDMRLSSTLTVVDVTIFDMIYENFGEFYKDQIETAGTVYLSHTDDEEADDEMIAETYDGVRRLNPEAAVITTPIDVLGAEAFLETVDGKTGRLRDFVRISLGGINVKAGGDRRQGGLLSGFRLPGEPEDPEADDDNRPIPASAMFETWSCETIRTFSKDEITAVLEDFLNSEDCGRIIRAKGLVSECERSDGGSAHSWIHFDLTPGRIDVREGTPGTVGQICVIGTALDTEKLDSLFK